MRTVRWYLAGGAVLAISIAASSHFRLPPRDVPNLRSPASSPLSPSAHAPTPSDPLRYSPKLHHQYTYRFSREILFKGLPSPSEPITYHGELVLQIVATDSQGFEALVQDQVSEAGFAGTSAKISIHADGTWLKLWKQPGSGPESDEHVSILKDLLSLWMFPLLQDTVGEFNAEFTQSPDGSRIKTKTAYRPNSAMAFQIPELTYSRHRLQWDSPRGLPESIEGQEHTRFESPTGVLTSESRYSIQLISDRVEPRKSSPAAYSIPIALQLSADSRSPGDHFVSKPLQWKVTEDELKKIDSLSGQERLRVFGDLLNELRSQKVSVEELIALNLNQDSIAQGAHSPLLRTSIGALSGLGTPRAQAALVSIYQDARLTVDGKGLILTALTTTQSKLSFETQNFLIQTLQHETQSDLAQGAGFALSASPSPEAIEIIRDRWIDQNTAHSPARDRLATLDMMGNSGSPAYLPILQSTLQNSPDREVKAKAVFALRFIPGDQAAASLITALLDSQATVREAAVDAIQFAPWREAFYAPLKNCGDQEPVLAIQAACRSVLKLKSKN